MAAYLERWLGKIDLSQLQRIRNATHHLRPPLAYGLNEIIWGQTFGETDVEADRLRA